MAVAFAEDDKERVTARAAAAPRSGWSGTIVWDYISQHHEVRDADTGGGYDSCTFSGERSVTWSLVRTKKLTLNKFGLYDRDQL